MFGEIYRLRKEDLGQWFDLWEKSGEDPESFRTAAEEKTDLIAKMKPDFMDDERFARIVFLAVSGSVELEEDKVPCEPPQEKDPSGFPDGGDVKGYLRGGDGLTSAGQSPRARSSGRSSTIPRRSPWCSASIRKSSVPSLSTSRRRRRG